MTIHLRPELEGEVRRLALERGANVDAIVDEAVRTYIEAAAAITDVTPEDIARTQEALISELPALEDWDPTEGAGGDATR